MPDVFISYARPDLAYADGRGMERVLRSLAPELTFWRDDSIGAGSVWADEICDNLRTAKAVIVIWSKNSWLSPWVRQEAFHAYMRGVLVPVRIDTVVLEPPFTSIQTFENNQRGFEAVVTAVRAKVRA